MMCTYLQQVTAAQIDALVAKPESIARLDEPETFATHYMARSTTSSPVRRTPAASAGRWRWR